MANFELVVLDCDGVLVDSERIAVRVGVRGLSTLGWTLDEDEFIERFIGRSTTHEREELVARLGAAAAEEWFWEFRRLCVTAMESELQPVDGIVDTLNRIATATCVASNNSYEHLKAVLSQTGLYERFEGRIFSAADVALGKPAPDLFLHAARCLGVAPSACAVVEDSVPGILAAQAAGMAAIAYVGGVTPRSQLALPGVLLLEHMSDLPGMLGQ